MDDIDSFISSPSDEFLEGCSKEQLLKIAEYYKLVIRDKRFGKESIKLLVKTQLVGKGFLKCDMDESAGASNMQTNLSFEQQKELLLLQMEHEKLKQRSEESKLELDKARLEVEVLKLNLIKEGKSLNSSELQGMSFSFSSNLKLVPKFNEEDPDTFFILFERMADMKEWSDTQRIALLQCVLVGKAQMVLSSVSDDDCNDYAKVKSIILKAYECVPEAYRQRFRFQRKDEVQSHLEFVKDLRRNFNRWCTALNVKTFEDLSHLMVLEQFRDTVPSRVAIYINERNVETPEQAAILADEFVLTHKSVFADVYAQTATVVRSPSKNDRVFSARFDPMKTCNYCREKGHWKLDCPVLEKISRRNVARSPVNSAVSVAPVQAEKSFGKDSNAEFLSSYLPFITEGRVSLGK